MGGFFLLKVQTDVEILLLAALTHINLDDAMQDCRKGEEGLEFIIPHFTFPSDTWPHFSESEPAATFDRK